jgi:hypothetical protein
MLDAVTRSAIAATPAGGPRRRAALAALAAAPLVIALDHSIVGVALSKSGPARGFADGIVQWVITTRGLENRDVTGGVR